MKTYRLFFFGRLSNFFFMTEKNVSQFGLSHKKYPKTKKPGTRLKLFRTNDRNVLMKKKLSLPL